MRWFRFDGWTPEGDAWGNPTPDPLSLSIPVADIEALQPTTLAEGRRATILLLRGGRCYVANEPIERVEDHIGYERDYERLFGRRA